MNKQLTIKGNYNIVNPGQMVTMAKALTAHIIKNNLSANIVGKNYAMVEGWQFAGGLTGMTARVVNVIDLSTGQEKKWRADVEIVRLKDNQLIGTGTAICSSSETKKKGFDEYAICSMAQTRAIGKAYRNTIGWVMKMAGYEATPSEEMVNMGSKPQNEVNVPNQPKNATEERTAMKKVTTVSHLNQLKNKLHKMGAKNEKEALALLKKKTGIIWKDFKNKTPKQIQLALNGILI